jgi:hypothetical protein
LASGPRDLVMRSPGRGRTFGGGTNAGPLTVGCCCVMGAVGAFFGARPGERITRARRPRPSAPGSEFFFRVRFLPGSTPREQCGPPAGCHDQSVGVVRHPGLRIGPRALRRPQDVNKFNFLPAAWAESGRFANSRKDRRDHGLRRCTQPKRTSVPLRPVDDRPEHQE